MPVIEGIGDEVLYFFVGLCLVFVSILAWLSTNTTERPLLRTVVILERHQPRVVASQSAAAPTSAEPGTPTAKPPETAETTQSESESRFETAAETLASASNDNIVASTLRRRRPQQPTEVDTHDACERTIHSNELLVEIMDMDTGDNPVSSSSDIKQDLPSSSEGTAEEDEGQVEEVEEAASVKPETNKSQTPSIKINLKYLNDDLKSVEGRLEEQVGDFKKRHFSLELSTRNIVRLVFNGKLLGQDTETLGNYGLHDNCVVHCLVHQQRTPPSSPNLSTRSRPASPEPRGISHWALSNILLVALSLLLGVAWYGRYQYSQWYTATTTVALVGLTGIFTIFLIGVYIPDTAQS